MTKEGRSKGSQVRESRAAQQKASEKNTLCPSLIDHHCTEGVYDHYVMYPMCCFQLISGLWPP